MKMGQKVRRLFRKSQQHPRQSPPDPSTRESTTNEESSEIAATPDIGRHVDREVRRLEREMDRRTDAMARQFDRVAKKLQRAMSEEAMTLRASAKDCASSVKAVQGALSEVRSEMQGVRDFAMTQQEQLRKYEDGYAWSSIKGLGMRLIRCIDDIDRMIALSGEGSGAIAKLQAVRDELLYALEAQGVEAVTPEDGSPYRGQEQWVKIAGTEETNDPSLNETISNTTRCGYWVEVADNRRKVIRPAESTVYKMEVKSNG